MKKIFLTILTFIYLMLSSGIAMEIHYCMGNRAGVDFFRYNDEKCGKCGMKEKKSGCCHDEHKFHKLQDSHKNVFNDISFETAEIAIVSTYPVFNWQMATDKVTGAVQNNSPPNYTGPSACILNCIFRL